ncbi:MAG TPA: outer membrane protein transport protein [Pseudolabrys sp.]|nr:outer membrane protein transport protein [Pseudolabrys sp.]
MLRAACALGLVTIATAQLTSGAQAGGFALREQSAAGQGDSFAGVAAGGALSSMFWNPAIITQYSGKAFETDVTGIIPKASQSYTSSTLASSPLGPAGYNRGADNTAESAIVPSSYSSWQLNDRLWIGLAVNSPFGLSVSFPQAWAGAGYGQGADVQSFNFSPTIAYKFSDLISVAVGAQVQYMKVSYDALAAPGLSPVMANLTGRGYGFGFTAGVTITPTPTTIIGVGYRSAINQDIDGTLAATTPGSTPGSISTTLNLPDMVTVGLRQRIGDRFTLLAGFEWTDWSRIGTAVVSTPTGTATLSGSPVTLPFQYSDGYFYSLGGEYIVDPSLTLRAGVAFETSPITDDVRTPRLPDNDRMWYSAGLSYKPPQFRGVTFDLGYSYIDVKDTPINIGAGSGNPWTNATGTYIGSVDSHIHVLSVGFRYQWGATPPPAVKLVTK